MYRKRRNKAARPEQRTSAGAWERLWMKRGALASATVASAFLALFGAIAFPEVAAAVFLVVLLLAVVSAYIAIICNDVGFDGELKDYEEGQG